MSHSRDFQRENGQVVTIEYNFDGGSGTTYDPRWGADSGDPPEIDILKILVDDVEAEIPPAELTEYEDAIYADPPEVEYPDYD